MSTLENTRDLATSITEHLSNVIKHSEELNSLINMGPPTGILHGCSDALFRIANILKKINEVVRLMQGLNKSLGSSIKVTEFKLDEFKKRGSDYISITYTYKLPHSEKENILRLIVGYANNKFAVFYNTDRYVRPNCITTIKQFHVKWWPKIANSLLNNSEKLL